MNAEPVVLVPYGSDPLANLAALMHEWHQRDLPDLSRHAVLLPSVGAIARFRRLLLETALARGAGGVLAPWCGTLDMWLELQANPSEDLVGEPERDLLLLEALAPYSALRDRYGTWPLIDSLLALFDELNAEHPAGPPDADRLSATLTAGYGLREPLPPLQGEAQLVHSLWTAWNEHLAGRRLHDRAQRRRAALAQPPVAGSHHIYVVGTVSLPSAEAAWLQARLDAGAATLVLHGSARPGCQPDAPLRRMLRALRLPPARHDDDNAAADAFARLLDAVYAEDTDIGVRARRFAADVAQSPLSGRLGVLAAADFEQEARAVDLAVRRWHAQGARAIGIVTPDRKLARRVRALLERANLPLRDAAGWALSTTSAATALVRWLECIEQDFAHAPLLDFLRSPFVTLGLERPVLETLAHAFEERIVRRRNISGGLDRYRRALRAHAGGNPETADDGGTTASLASLLDRLAEAAEPLRRVCVERPRPTAEYLDALHDSLARAGLVDGLNADAAGAQLLAALRPHRVAAASLAARLHWSEFRHWLQRELERRRFHPPLPPAGIELLDFADSRCRRFDALVIAGCTREHMPGALRSSPFFNDAVRASLGLATREERLLVALHDFRRLLEAAPRVLLTWRRLEDGEEVVPSPWTERLLAFHRLAYGGVPEDIELRALLAAPQTELYRRDGAPLPAPAAMPAPRLPPARLPAALSASSHQRLLDCPYQFFAAEGLGLRALDEVRDEMEKSDYGQSVHRILHAFHGGVPGLPGPWAGGTIDAAKRADARALLLDIGRRVFAADSDHRLSARGWRHRWESFVDVYLDWHEERARTWQVAATEQPLERRLDVAGRTVLLKGRADRVERGEQGLAIVDYKTGAVPDPEAVVAGEQAQLPFYALLHPEAVTEVTYAQLLPDAVKTNVRLEGEELADLVQRLDRRLHAVLENIERGAPLPAWGDSSVCRFCRYEGVCRKEMWGTDAES